MIITSSLEGLNSKIIINNEEDNCNNTMLSENLGNYFFHIFFLNFTS